MDGPLVSIIVPIYNAEKYLTPCISSCVDQSYEMIEILLVDDGSTDSSQEICRDFASRDERIKVFCQQNAGVSAARNTGIRNASGDYLFFLDSDDEIIPDGIELLLNDIQKYKADVVSAAHCTVDVEGREGCRCNNGEVEIYENDEPLILSLKYDRRTSSVWAKLFSKRILEGVFFVEGRHINEDGYFVFQCYAKKPKLVCHNEVVYKYYHRENSSTRGVFSEKYFDMIYFSDRKMKYIRETRPDLIKYAKDMEISTNLFLLEALCRDEASKYKKETENSIRLVRKGYLKYKPINRHEKIMAAITAFGFYPWYKRHVLRTVARTEKKKPLS